MQNSEISISTASKLLDTSNNQFVKVFAHGSLVVEYYRPQIFDQQKPHERDEVYVITAGEGVFFNEGRRFNFKTGDLLFVPAGAVHRFEKFSDNFETWVLFYGPIGGEMK